MNELFSKLVKQKEEIIVQWINRIQNLGGSYSRANISEVKDLCGEFIPAFFEAVKDNNLTQLRIFIGKLCNIRSSQGFRLSEVQRAYCYFADVIKPVINNIKIASKEKIKIIDLIEDVLLETMFELSEAYHRKLDEKVDDYVDQIEQINVKLKEDSIRDGLTGCYNRRYFQDIIASEISRASRYDRSLSLLMLDIDDFKKLNDTYSHVFGDKVLKAVGESIRHSVRDVDMVFRYGGEEFSVIMPDTHKDAAFVGAERIRKNIEKLKFNIKDKIIKVTVSCGGAELCRKEANKGSLVSRVDRALYSAKAKGKNQTIFYKE